MKLAKIKVLTQKYVLLNFLILCSVLFGSLSCTDEQFLLGQQVAAEILDNHVIVNPLANPTHLRIVNEIEEEIYSINAVELAHYSFKKLNIPQGKSKKLTLAVTGGLPVNTNGLEITLTFSSSTRTIVEKGIIDLYPGGTTVIWLTGREACYKCGGHSIEWGWED